MILRNARCNSKDIVIRCTKADIRTHTTCRLHNGHQDACPRHYVVRTAETLRGCETLFGHRQEAELTEGAGELLDWCVDWCVHC